MDLRTIKTFYTIARLGSFQKAADELMYVQSTVTMQIQKLETDLGVKLIERGKKIHLTDAGRVFFDKADLLLRDLEYVQNTMHEWVHGEAGKIRIGAIEPMAIYRLPEILEPFNKKYPKVQISIQVNNTQTLTKMIKDGELDIALCNTPVLDHTTLFEPLLTEQVSLLLPAAHHLAERDEIYLADFKNERLLLGAFVCNYRINLEKSLVEAGIQPQVGLEINSMSALKEYVQAGLGIAVIPDVIIRTPPVGTTTKKVVDLNVGVVTGILRKTNNITAGTAIERLIALIKENF
ncbi:LysR family transcriptional regulator [Domibacillus sp. DTU_2020_1001157_1_SI_ALB_TIR_016]|uniref:LysR family transcriptional regulator n=1 Tax=Domibacillus sp. DTU_2020_1001157_1_SI_ALB_TIR_016 TaxID=3077789 RepID=UPI0028F04DE6|nr:LysR family transcriptional regulator [Domibacillus sp. DTU_2020_1001157_1_SI_ALB_TIR_016]WNS78358.1 LysR family transcriptional regulator [Domibacillus sp. DTU_2020_1001157_1_SI_ALB_TIR_016]